MMREMRVVVLAALFAVCLLGVGLSSAQAGGYDIAWTYPPYPEVGSYVDHYDHAAAYAWESYERAVLASSVAPPEAVPVAAKVPVRRGLWGRWGYRR